MRALLISALVLVSLSACGDRGESTVQGTAEHDTRQELKQPNAAPAPGTPIHNDPGGGSGTAASEPRDSSTDPQQRVEKSQPPNEGKPPR